ncbi:MAG: hypothetical protein ABIQ13_11405 [Pedococcus sp.]
MTDLAHESPLRSDAQHLRAAELDVLLGQSALGDHTAFGTLYDRTVNGFFGLALVVLGDHGRAEETTRAAYAEIWATSRSFNSAEHRSLSWMTTIVYEIACSARSTRAA